MTAPPPAPEESRPPLFSSISYTGPSSSLARASLKRSITTADLDFSSSADTFRPKPYSPARASCSTNSRHNVPHRAQRISIASPPLALDVSDMDPDAIFIHPPFNNFPGAESYPDGLTFSLMAEHPDWFLDPRDYHPLEGPCPANAIPYPTNLEPPRGWCPAKKREIKEKGTDWAEGEEPKLRCTFCRRSYAGVNAKSMWRRHVFEKHKVAMSNRREGCDRPRGRGSMKENRRPQKPREEHDSLLGGIEVAPQTDVDNAVHKSRFQGVQPRSDGDDQLDESVEQTSASQPELSSGSDDNITPPSTPPPLLPEVTEDTKAVTSSPYDPSLTPAFRHSSPKLPSDQPWRFPSPTHPLHSRQRQVSLTQLIHTPGAKSFVASATPDRIRQLSRQLVHNPSPLKSMMLPPSSPVLTPVTSPHYRLSDDSDTLMNESDDEIVEKWRVFGPAVGTSSPFRLSYEGSASPLASLVADSPILRDTAKPRGRAIGLLEPISLHLGKGGLPGRSSWDEEDDEDDDGGLMLGSPFGSNRDGASPAPKRRKISLAS